MNEDKYEIRAMGKAGIQHGYFREDLPVVDESKLAQVLGIETWQWPLVGWSRYAARVITDFATSTKSEDVAISNARVWVELAYEQGIAGGQRQEREKWQTKIRKMFDL